MEKTNCWEFMHCGREPGGEKAEQLGVCPAAAEERLDGVHGGRHGGRACWVVAGSLCGGEVQGSFAKKFHNCIKCGFYQAVKEQEGGCFELTPVLLSKVREGSNAAILNGNRWWRQRVEA